ncbi:MAG: hypothetical protein KBD64_06535 [Gammaproteobacteria bacterium]|nr:hypothetical protein [Gammaproteobacteria bacterium]
MFKKIRRIFAAFVGAVIVGPLVGALAGLLFDPSWPVPVNIVLVATLICFGVLLLTGLSLGLSALAGGIFFLVGTVWHSRQVKASNASRLSAEIKAEKENTRRNVYKPKVDEIINKLQQTPPYTPVVIGYKAGMYSANFVASKVAGEEGFRIYNIAGPGRTKDAIDSVNGYDNEAVDTPLASASAPPIGL